MRRVPGVLMVALIAVVVLSCGTPATIPPTATPAQATAAAGQVAEEAGGAEATPEPGPFPLSEPGPYCVGVREFSTEDSSRPDRGVGVRVWYPAACPEDAGRRRTFPLAEPDRGGAPYPLILTGPDTGEQLFKTHLASHGFVMVIVRFPEYYETWDLGIIDHPRDILFALDQMASQPLEGLEGVVDADRAGVAGHSWEGFYTFTLSGARINPERYVAFCDHDPATVPELSSSYFGYICHLAENWDEFAAYVGKAVTANDDGLWQTITDPRLRAFMPMAEYGTWWYDERGLSGADRPMFIIAPTEDEFIPYELETAYVFEHAGSPERFLVSFVGKHHLMVTETSR